MAKKSAVTASFENPTTAAVVNCANWGFYDADGNDDSETIGCEATVKFNGVAGEFVVRPAAPRNATTAQKQTAVRLAVNAILASVEPGNSLTNANIQITGLPV